MATTQTSFRLYSVQEKPHPRIVISWHSYRQNCKFSTFVITLKGIGEGNCSFWNYRLIIWKLYHGVSGTRSKYMYIYIRAHTSSILQFDWWTIQRVLKMWSRKFYQEATRICWRYCRNNGDQGSVQMIVLGIKDIQIHRKHRWIISCLLLLLFYADLSTK